MPDFIEILQAEVVSMPRTKQACKSLGDLVHDPCMQTSKKLCRTKNTYMCMHFYTLCDEELHRSIQLYHKYPLRGTSHII